MNELRKLLTAQGAFWRDYSSGDVRRTVYQGMSGTVAVISAPDVCEEGQLIAWVAGHEALSPMSAKDVVRRYPPCTRGRRTYAR